MSHAVSFSSTYQLYDSQKKHPEAEIQISKRSCVSFKCTRIVPWINQKIGTIFFNAIRGYAYVDLDKNLQRSFLAESQDSLLDRKENHTRFNYETHVIHKILRKIGSKKEFYIKLAICESGKLLSEQILLFRLLYELSKRERAGVIDLILIDPTYHSLNENAKSGDFIEALGEQKYAQQFLEEISQCLPENISIEGRFFENAQQYVDQLSLNQTYDYDLLIGTNLNSNPDFWELENLLENAKTRSAVWTHTTKLPDANLSLTTLNELRTFCPQEGGGMSSFKLKEDKTHPILLIAGISMVVLLGAAYFKGPQQ